MGGIGGVGRQEAVHLIEDDERAQALGAGQGADPGEHFFEQHAEHERALFVVQVGHADDHDWRLAGPIAGASGSRSSEGAVAV